MLDLELVEGAPVPGMLAVLVSDYFRTPLRLYNLTLATAMSPLQKPTLASAAKELTFATQNY